MALGDELGADDDVVVAARRRIELLAIGMGHDVSRFYRRATAIASADGLGETLITCLRELFDP